MLSLSRAWMLSYVIFCDPNSLNDVLSITYKVHTANTSYSHSNVILAVFFCSIFLFSPLFLLSLHTQCPRATRASLTADTYLYLSTVTPVPVTCPRVICTSEKLLIGLQGRHCHLFFSRFLALSLSLFSLRMSPFLFFFFNHPPHSPNLFSSVIGAASS